MEELAKRHSHIPSTTRDCTRSPGPALVTGKQQPDSQSRIGILSEGYNQRNGIEPLSPDINSVSRDAVSDLETPIHNLYPLSPEIIINNENDGSDSIMSNDELNTSLERSVNQDSSDDNTNSDESLLRKDGNICHICMRFLDGKF